MAELDDEEKLKVMVEYIVQNCPKERAHQFIADQLSLAWGIGYKAGKRDR